MEEQRMKCWTCNEVKPESVARVCTRPHCRARAELERCGTTVEIRPPQPNMVDDLGGGGVKAYHLGPYEYLPNGQIRARIDPGAGDGGIYNEGALD